MIPNSDPDTLTYLASHTTLYALESGRIQRLNGFIKSAHRVPQNHSPATEAFVQKIGSDLVHSRGADLFHEIRKSFALKRTEISLTNHPGLTQITTPTFNLSIRINQLPDAPKNYQISTEFVPAQDFISLNNPSYLSFFDRHANALRIDLPNPLNIPQIIDRIETFENYAEHLNYPPNAQFLSFRLPDSPTEIHLDPSQIKVTPFSPSSLPDFIKKIITLLFDLTSAPGNSTAEDS